MVKRKFQETGISHRVTLKVEPLEQQGEVFCHVGQVDVVVFGL